MRLRLLLPRRGRGRSKRRLVPAAAVAAVALAGCGGSDEPRAITHAPLTAPSLPRPAAPRLAIGLTEFNANLLWHGRPVPDGFEPWRSRVEALEPKWFRLVVDWHALQPRPGAALDFTHPADGCLRGLPPCGPFNGLRDVLRAVASQQRAHPGAWQLLVVITGTPDWAATAPHGCARDDSGPLSRPIDTEALPGYRNLIRQVLALAQREGAPVRALSPWNEPNHPAFISPQRVRCDAHAPLLSTKVYARLADAARAELHGTDVKLVLGELAGASAPSPHLASAGEFAEDLPRGLICAADVFSQHQYARRGKEAGLAGPVGQLERALDKVPCARHTPIWITETGAGAPHAGDKRSLDPADLAAGCRAQATALRRWSRDKRITATFQYTFREDTAFPVGLADARLTRLYPTYGLFRRASRDGDYAC